MLRRGQKSLNSRLLEIIEGMISAGIIPENEANRAFWKRISREVAPTFRADPLDPLYEELVELQVRACTNESRTKLTDELDALVGRLREEQIRGREAGRIEESGFVLGLRARAAALGDQLSGAPPLKGQLRSAVDRLDYVDSKSEGMLAEGSVNRIAITAARKAGVDANVAEVIVEKLGRGVASTPLASAEFWQSVKAEVLPVIANKMQPLGGWKEFLSPYLILVTRWLVLQEPAERLLDDAQTEIRIRERLRDCMPRDMHQHEGLIRGHLLGLALLEDLSSHLRQEIQAEQPSEWAKRVEKEDEPPAVGPPA